MLNRLRIEVRLAVCAVAVCTVAVGTVAGAGPAAAFCASRTTGDITVENVWSRASIIAGRPGVLYMTIRNDGATEDRLVDVATPAAAQAMLHETVVKDGMATMPHISAVPVPAGETVGLRPGGTHAMLMDPAEPLREGVSFPVTLTFAKAGTLTVPVDVLSLSAETSECDGGR